MNRLFRSSDVDSSAGIRYCNFVWNSGYIGNSIKPVVKFPVFSGYSIGIFILPNFKIQHKII